MYCGTSVRELHCGLVFHSTTFWYLQTTCITIASFPGILLHLIFAYKLEVGNAWGREARVSNVRRHSWSSIEYASPKYFVWMTQIQSNHGTHINITHCSLHNYNFWWSSSQNHIDHRHKHSRGCSYAPCTHTFAIYLLTWYKVHMWSCTNLHYHARE